MSGGVCMSLIGRCGEGWVEKGMQLPCLSSCLDVVKGVGGESLL